VHDERILVTVFQVHEVVKSRCGGSKLTFDISGVTSAIQDPDKLALYHTPHGLTNTGSQTDRPVTICEKVIPTMFQDSVTTPYLQIDGKDFCDLIQTVEIQWVWMEDETASCYGHHHGLGMCCGSSKYS
jgi:hypothetical protein